jgi:glycosyltransferase involved in cell wall biosynthesis
MKTCETFAKQGIEVELWIPCRQNRWFSHLDPFAYHGIERNFRIRRLPALDFMGFFPGSFFFFLMLATFQISAFLYYVLKSDFLKKSDFAGSVLYFHDVRDALLFSFLRRPMFLEIHDFYKSSVDWINRLVFKHMTGFIVTNRLKMEALKKDFGIPEERMLHQPNAVDVGMFSPDISREEAKKKLGLPLDKKIVLYAGHLFYWKGADVLLEAAKQFSILNFQFSKNTNFVFVGGTDEDIINFRKKAEGYDSIKIIGRRPHQEIPLWLRAADVLVLPSPAKYQESKYETSPVKLFEYMASGAPIVASDVPSIRNIVDDSMVWFFEADNPASLADVIKKAISDKDASRKKAKNAREKVQTYDWKMRAERIRKFLLSRVDAVLS